MISRERIFGRESFHSAKMMKSVPSQLSIEDPRYSFFVDRMRENDKKLQSEVAEAIQEFDPVTDEVENFDYTKVGEILRQATVQEMATMFDYRPALAEVLDEILNDQITVPFIGRVTQESEAIQAQHARAFHVGYISGQIERCFPSLRSAENPVAALKMARIKIQREVNQVLGLKEGDQPASFEQKLALLKPRLETILPDDKEGLSEAIKLLTENQWLLDDFNEQDELAVDMNEAGLLASRAVVEFAQKLYPGKDRVLILRELEEIFNKPDEELQNIALRKEKKRGDGVIDAQIIFFAVRAANYSWIFSKIPQGFTEQKQVINKMEAATPEEEKRRKLAEWQASKPAKGAGRYTRGEKQNKYFTTFDNMSDDKGWPAVLLDMDQIRTGIRILLSEYNAKVEK